MEALLKQLGVTEEELNGTGKPKTPSQPPSLLASNAVYLLPVAVSSLVMGFFGTLAVAKRKDADAFQKGLLGAPGMESGSSLAFRALGRGSLYALGGCTLVSLAIYKAYPLVFPTPDTQERLDKSSK